MRKLMKKSLSFMLALAMVVTTFPQTQLINVSADENTPYCISEGRPTYVSSGNNEEFAVDGDVNTRWQAANDDKNEWFYVDLGKVADIDSIFIKWEAAYAKSYEIQFSQDEMNWNTVYTKGKGASTGGETVSQAMTVSRNSLSTKTVGGELKTVTTMNWSSLDGVSYYYIYLDDIANKTPATAADGYPFSGNWGTRTNCEVWVREGEHTYTVIGYDANNKEIARASMVIDSADIEAETTEAVDDGVDPLEHTITFDNLGTSEKQARYVKIVMTERQLEAYGCSFFEFQVYGTNGLVERPADYGKNLALNQPVKSSGIRDEWWMYDENGVIRPDAVKNVREENAVDGDKKTSFTSYQGDDQWIYVDLGQPYTLGRVVIDWNTDAGKMYDVDVSTDGQTWTTVHRVLRGYTEMEDNFTFYKENIRYVRVFGYTKVESGSGFGINELEVYEYVEGDSKANETIEALPVRQIVNNTTGKGSYVSGEMYNEKNKLPTFVNEENVQTPIDSNSWWSSALVKTFSNLLCSTPLKTKFSTKGLSVLAATSGWVGTRGINDLGTNQETEIGIDFYVMPDGYNTSKGYDRVESYGDYSVEIGLMDNNGLQMKTTVVKGSPYLYNEFENKQTVFINSSSISEVFDGNGKTILNESGDEVVTDHIGFTTLDAENTKTFTSTDDNGTYYCINVPEGTTFKAMVVGAKDTIKITFPTAKNNYMSIAAMTAKDQINEYYQHGYAFVKDTYVGYSFDEATSKVVTNYEVTTELKRSGFSNVTMQAMFPHQWKMTTADDEAYTTYTSIRGDMKAIWANTYTTTQQFAGLLPTFALPDSEMMDSAEMIEYLNAVVASKINTTPVSDAYWEGKNVHPLAISAMMADQLGETEIKDKLLKKLKSIFVDWFNYDGEGDECYLIYNKDWGTVYYPNSAYGANAAICDHNFTYGYFAYGAAVLAMYDKDFLRDYGDMVEILIRDYANPLESEEDGMFCKFRSFDQYAGHAWAGGYGDNDSGNNQESASEGLFSWVGMYLWGQVTQNQKYIDAAAYGFTTEMYAVLQYWFDYDETNWLEEFPFEGVGQIYGATMGYGTYFGGQPTYIYGIQWLPISEYLTNYGMNQAKCAKVYAGLEYDTQYAIDIEMRLGNITDPDQYVTPDNGWQHITWPFLSQSDPQRAYDKFEANVTRVQTEDRANTLWFIAAMDQLGYRTTDYVVVGDIQGSVYYNDDTEKYTAEVWNPTDETQTVTIKDKTGKVAGTANIGSKGLVSFEIDTDKTFALSQVATPVMKATALSDGKVTNGISGEVTFDDTQIVEITCSEPGATVYYTTDGTTPTTESPVYSEKILVSSDTTVKAIAIKEGYINSAYAASAIIIAGDKIQSSDNLAMGRVASASSEDKPAANAIDGNAGTMWQADTEVDADAQWFQVDLGSVQAVNTVTINWETAYAAKYKVQVSIDGDNWTTVDEVNGVVGEVTSTFAATRARYVRMQGVSRGTQYGYGILEFEVYGAVQAKAPTITPISGTYDGAQTVTMSTVAKGAEIKYTTDGTDPTEDSATYTAPITVSKSTVIKAITYRKGMIVSDVTKSEIIISGTISLNKTSDKIAIDRTTQLVAMTDEKVTWTSSNTTAATVDQNGLVTGKAVGTSVITATTAGGETASCTITVTEPVHISSIAIKPATLEMKNKSSETLEIIITPADTTDDTTVTWSSSDENVLVVNENGTLTGKAEGSATITAKVGKFTATCEVVVGPAATTEEMILSSKYNAALRKKIEGKPSVQEGSITAVTDGNIAGSHAATKFGTAGTYFEIDLGDTYDASGIDQIVTVYKEESDGDTPVKGYEIQYSDNGVDFVTVKTVNGPEAKQAWIANNLTDIQTVTATGAVRYVRLYYPDSYTWGIQAREIAVLSTEQNLKTVEVERCSDPADLTVSSDAYCEITYTITAAEGQDGYKYMVYLNGNKVADMVDAGTYTLTGIEAGTHTVKVISYYDKKTSEGISKTVEVDDGSLVAYVNTPRNLSLGATVTVDAIETEHEEGSKDTNTLVNGVISKDTDKVVETTWGSKTATILMDLGREIDKNSISEVLIAFKADNTNATDYTIEFSADGKNYETVITVVDGVYDKEANEHLFDSATYTQDIVQYVRINITDGNSNWGYQISEIAIMGGDEYMPVEVEGLVATSPNYNTISVTWTGGTNGQIYSVYIDGAIKGMNIVAPGTYTYAGIDGGTHTVKVTAKLNGIESKGVTATVYVEEAPPTTPVPTTPKPTTPEPSSSDNPSSGDEPSSSDQPSSSDDSSSSDGSTTDEASSNDGQTTDEPSSNGGTTVVPTTAAPTTKVQPTTTKKVTVGKTKVKKASKKKVAKKIKISLKKIKGAKKYQIQISKKKKFNKKNILVRKTVKKAKFTISKKKLKNKKKLWVRARAIKIVNGKKYTGKWSKKKKVKIKK